LKILAISDLHGNEYDGLYNYLEKNNIDLILISGDLTHFGPLNFARKVLNKLANLTPMVMAIPGNCDPEGIVEEIEKSEAICCHNHVIGHENLVIYGFGGSNPTPFNTPGEFDEKTLYNSIKSVMDSKDIKLVKEPSDSFPYGKIPILLTHAPPKDTDADKIEDGSHVGSESVRKIIEEYAPCLNICGHIHEAKSCGMIENTTITNPGMLEHGYGALIEIEDNNNIIVNFVQLE
jgi:Icc-related predicted phosphoesterase